MEDEPEETFCSICLESDTDDDNLILYCDNCNVPVHQICYGVMKIPSGNWYCYVCAKNGDVNNTKCQLCPFKGGAYKPTTKNSWVHALCANWIPEVSAADETGKKVNISDLDHERLLRCQMCNQKGYCVQCYHKKCTAPVHPYCVMNNCNNLKSGFTYHTDYTEDSNAFYYVCFCKKHNDANPEYDEISQKVQFNLKRKELVQKMLENLANGIKSSEDNDKSDDIEDFQSSENSFSTSVSNIQVNSKVQDTSASKRPRRENKITDESSTSMSLAETFMQLADSLLSYRNKPTHLQKVLESMSSEAKVFSSINDDSLTHLLVRIRRAKAIDLLAEQGLIPINELNKFGESPLFLAAQKGSEPCLQVLLKYKADISIGCAVSFNGLMFIETPLLAAIRKNYFHCVKRLLDSGASIQNPSDDIESATAIATRLGFDKVLELLISYGADINAKNVNNEDCLMIATKLNHEKCLLVIQNAISKEDAPLSTILTHEDTTDTQSDMKIDQIPIVDVSFGVSCLLCKSANRDVVFMPCYHICVCSVCGLQDSLKQCLICSDDINDRHQVFLS